MSGYITPVLAPVFGTQSLGAEARAFGGDEGVAWYGSLRHEAAHTVSIWNSDKRGTGARRIVAIGGLRGPDASTVMETRRDGSAWLKAYHDERDGVQVKPIRWVF